MKDSAVLEALVIRARGLRLGVGDAELDRIADLARRIMADQARRAGAVLPAHLQRTHAETTEGERQGARSAVGNVLIALVLLELIELPGS